MDLEEEILESFQDITGKLAEYFRVYESGIVKEEFKLGASGSREIVTEIDREVEGICIDTLQSSFPAIPVFAEERYNYEHAVLESQWIFVVDPIDGTTEFMKGSDEWSVSIAAVKESVPQVGILFLPCKKIRLWACRGGGVICNGDEVQAEIVRTEKLRIAVSPRQIQMPEFESKIYQSGLCPVPVPTFTVKIASILLNQVDAAVYFPQQGKSANVWDYAASVLLIQEFCGRISSLDGSVLPFRGDGIIHRDGWLATNAFCDHLEILRRLQ